MTQPPPLRRSGVRAWDFGLYGLGFLFTVIGLMNLPPAWTNGSSSMLVLAWALGVGAWVTVFFRRSRPLLVVGAGAVLALIGSEYLLMLIGVYHALVVANRRRQLVLGGAATGIVGLFWLREITTVWGDQAAYAADESALTAAIVSGFVALASLAVTFGLAALSHSQRAADSQRARADTEHTLATQLGDELARQAERSEIAREIHDGLTNKLALVSMMSANVEKAVVQGDPRAPGLARELQGQARLALAELRGLVENLRTEPDSAHAARGSMRTVGEVITATRAAGTPVDAIVILDGAHHAPESLDSAVYRLVQEALTNAVKHAPGRTISLFLEANPTSGVRLRVTNVLAAVPHSGDGRGAGAGLVGIRERVTALHGTLWAGPYEGEFIVDVTVPWPAPSVSAADAPAGAATGVPGESRVGP
ncbi:sensor histidine kinase [Demequina globuliformis]|uniref:sensor histidine kinase n=1 Tax=Demequina globuliformis TaxID=676202 RepID=UPI0013792E7E|nr:histidine kinase [Demequina globuliformis]